MKELLNLGNVAESTNTMNSRLGVDLETQDFEAAFKDASVLDKRGVVNGTYALSQMYHNGDGVKQNYKKEVALLWRASIRGHKPSIYNLSLALMNSKGVKHDSKLALYLMESLVEDGYEPAFEMLMEAVA